MQTVQRVLREIDTAFRAAHGVTVAEAELLFLLSLRSEPQRVLDLTRMVLMSQSSVSRTLARLDGQGLVTREVSAEDARATLAAITPAGLDLVHDLRRIEEEVVHERVFARIGDAAPGLLEGIWGQLAWDGDDPVYAAIAGRRRPGPGGQTACKGAGEGERVPAGGPGEGTPDTALAVDTVPDVDPYAPHRP